MKNILPVFISLSYTVVFLVFLTGCGQKLPRGMPELYETVLTVTQDGSPLTKATVQVISSDYTATPYSGGGQTDNYGKIRLITEGRYSGLPAGSYIVTVSKSEGPDIKLPDKAVTDEEIHEVDKIIAEIAKNTFEIVDEKFAAPETSPLRLEVKKKTSETFDVSPKVKRKLLVDKTKR